MKNSMPPDKKRASRGFTIIETMIVILASSILALVVGTMLAAGYAGWRYNNNALTMNRDASLAMEVIAREIRNSGIDDIKIGNVSFSANTTAQGSSLQFAANEVRSPAISVVKSGDKLVYDSGDFDLVRADVQNFFVEFVPRGPRVHVVLQLFDAEVGEIILEGSYRTRNDG